MKTAPKFPKFVPKLLVFDGNHFQAFGLEHKGTQYFDNMKYTYRYIDTIPMLAHALQANFPERFKPGSPPFELLFTDADSPHSNCENQQCKVQDFAPMILFGSVPKDESIYPTLRSFPHPVFMHCLYHYKVNGVETCDWPQKPNLDVAWDDLEDTIIWRGADWPFLPYIERYTFEGPTKVMEKSQIPSWREATKESLMEDITTDDFLKTFPPRWRAALMSVRAEDDETPWIDTRFVGGMHTEIHAKLATKGINVTGDRIDAYEMSNYKYQVDFGGGGGTTWEGTLTKLLMPGVLMHHETETKDWYYDMMIPWKHYIPIKWDLSDLWASFNGAQEHQQQMQDISAEATKLAEYMLSPEYMEKVYQELFVDYLGKLVNAYEAPEGATWSDIAAKYKSNGFNVYNIGNCQKNICKVQCRKGIKENLLYINGDQEKRNKEAAAAAADGEEEEEEDEDAPEAQVGVTASATRALGEQQYAPQQQQNQQHQYQQPQSASQEQYSQQQQQYPQQQQQQYQQQYDANGPSLEQQGGAAYAYDTQQQQQQWSQGGDPSAQQQQWSQSSGAGYGDANDQQEQQQQQQQQQQWNQDGTARYGDANAQQPQQQQDESIQGRQLEQESGAGYGDANAQQQQQQQQQWNSNTAPW
eukprot:CAMPEP_0119013432 /NCGR_PEP_ID=MMETSP1176-20130426/8444_1 /TAXON_ID=265551 /ORGANISM="Synedropsis recta cf, Strain CCMP1620" /LENGTH=640 /DNA_ID=CAMNT_0006966523 /DNA_START=276 /DNA_END=2195 /DNA_ORIENTATION=-